MPSGPNDHLAAVVVRVRLLDEEHAPARARDRRPSPRIVYSSTLRVAVADRCSRRRASCRRARTSAPRKPCSLPPLRVAARSSTGVGDALPFVDDADAAALLDDVHAACRRAGRTRCATGLVESRRRPACSRDAHGGEVRGRRRAARASWSSACSAARSSSRDGRGRRRRDDVGAVEAAPVGFADCRCCTRATSTTSATMSDARGRLRRIAEARRTRYRPSPPYAPRR